MGKYVAVIHDAFREAFASRVLWLMLIGITLVLISLAPLSYREVVTTKIAERDLRQPEEFMVLLRQEGPKNEATPVGHVWQKMSDKTRTRLTNVKIPGKDPDVANPFEFLGLMGVLRSELNKQLDQTDFYVAEIWKDAPLSEEARQLRAQIQSPIPAAQPSETAADRARFHRLLLEAAFPEYIRASSPTSVQFVYGWMDAGSAQPIRSSLIRQTLQDYASGVFGLLIGTIAVFVAILVTAPVIPQMFDAGSLHLLLSKPVSRWMLFLAKYLGGCAFIAICAVYLIGGLWLILGTRFGVWDGRLLYSIPIYLFVFAIYYSVSSLAGVIWRSPIVSIACSVLFWLACFVIGTVKSGVIENMFVNKERFVRVIQAGDALFGIDEFGWGYSWQKDKDSWEDVLVLPDQRQARTLMLVAPLVPRQFRAVGHVYDEQRDSILVAVPTMPPSSQRLAAARRDSGWELVSNQSAPLGTLAMFREPGGTILAASSLGLARLTGDPLQRREPKKLFGLIPLPASGPFQTVNPDPPVLITQPAAVAMHSASGGVAIFTRGMLYTLSPTDGRFAKRSELKLDGDSRQSAVLAWSGRHVVVGRDDGRIQVFDTEVEADTLQLQREFSPEGRNAPRFLDGSPDGQRFAVVFHTGHLWVFDAGTNQIVQPPVSGQGDISAANFASDGSLFVVDRMRRVSQYDPMSWERRQRYSPKLGTVMTVYRYGILPLYTVFPKPGELNNTFQYLLTKETTHDSGDGDEDLTSARRKINPWLPLASSAAFTLVVLAIACIYIEYQDF